MRSLAAVLPDVIDELSVAVPEYICPPKDDGAFLCRLNAPLHTYTHVVCAESEWIKVDILETTQKIIARASSRVFVGLPACACTSRVISSCIVRTTTEASMQVVTRPTSIWQLSLRWTS